MIRINRQVPALMILSLTLFAGQSLSASADLKPVNLRTEYKINPVTDVSTPG
ncbi:hypothetical protein [Spirosoma sp. KNUC1025]|uniref:hypothetical protein n=1 Tax=Spirosoma sp. KNUC1025 TaxID=2894082 RepID=UPI00386FE333|nr:hypothetical protein LN737_17345 [Spirosoma sp. KNUC1025]